MNNEGLLRVRRAKNHKIAAELGSWLKIGFRAKKLAV